MFGLKVLPRFIFLLFSLIFFLFNCATARKIERTSAFDYENIYKKQYQEGNGGTIRLTLEKGETYSGSITSDGKYLFYTSNQNGNFDIYLRSLSDIINIPVFHNSTNETDPAISPDGKYLAFVDDEIDPEGDVAIAKINSDHVHKVYQSDGQSAVDNLFINTKTYLTNDPQNISHSRDANPTWSPDSEWIAYSSNKSPNQNNISNSFGAIQNIWIMPFKNPEKSIQITTDGGVMPCYSADGKKILYANDNYKTGMSHIFVVELSSGQTRQLTNGNAIDLYPGYSNDGKKIFFTRIASDTNGDGNIDYKDNGQIMVQSLDQESDFFSPAIEMTFHNQNVFNTKVTSFLGGSILFAMKEADNINLALIPETGIFPDSESALKQFQFATNLAKHNESVTSSQMALQLLEFRNPANPINKFVSTLKDFELLESETASVRKKAYDLIQKKIQKNILFEKIMLDVYYKKHTNEIPDNYVFQFEGKTLTEYLEEIFKHPLQALQSEKDPGVAEQNIQLDKLSVYEQNTLGYLLEMYGSRLKNQGKIDLSKKVFQSIVYNLPEYYNNPSIVYEQGKNFMDNEIPNEYLYILAPQKYPLTIFNYLPASVNVASTNSTPETGLPGKALNLKISPEIIARVQNDIFLFLKKACENNQEQIIQTVKEKYNSQDFSVIANLLVLARTEYLFDDENYKEAALVIQGIDEKSFQDKQWKFKFFMDKGKILEKTSQIDKAYNSYFHGLLNYEKKVNSGEIENLTLKVISYYRKYADLQKKSGKINEAWTAFIPLIQLVLYLEPRGIADNVVKSSSLHIFIDLDEMLLKYNDEKTIKAVLEFYKTNIDYARKNTLNSFIFARAYLNAMYGIQLHQKFETLRQLNSDNKETVLSYFYEAEEDFQWSIYADASFADAYIMLGWMYQFIDEKRDLNVFLSKNDKDVEKDKDLFKTLYQKYFPDYLYEKNIQLYQKSLTYIPANSNTQIKQSLYLNLANNYFLLNNFAKADENYARISIEKDKYVFESEDQQAQFYFHSGKASFFLGNYANASLKLENALTYYPTAVDKNPQDQLEAYLHRSLILKYLGMTFSYAGKFDKAADYYKKIIDASKRINFQENFSTVYLEISRNLLAQINLTHDLGNVTEALNFLNSAESSIHKFPFVDVPKYPVKMKIFGLTLPFNFNIKYLSRPDDVFRSGENHIAYPLPTINQLEYLYSTRADLYKLTGSYSKAATAIKLLIAEAEKDETKHGRQTLLSALMRLAEIHFIEGNPIEAKNFYEIAKQKAQDSDNMKIFNLAEKNLMTLACHEIEKSKSGLEKNHMAVQYLKELKYFKKQFLKLAIDKAEQEIKEKNSNLKLTFSEKASIEKEALANINHILIYKGVFEAYISMTEMSIAPEKPIDLTAYYDITKKQYENYKKTLHSLDGYARIEGEDITLIDRKKDRRLAIILDMNKGLVYESMGDFSKATQIYKNIYDKAFEFKANEMLVVSGFRYYRLLNSSESQDAYKVLQKIDSTFKLNPFLRKKQQDIFREINYAMIHENLENKQFINTIYLENFNRILELRETVEVLLNSACQTNASCSDLTSELNEFKELEKIEEILATDIENLKIRRESTESLETIMEQLLNTKERIKNSILKNPKLSGYAYALFPDLLTINDINKIKSSYLYIIQNQNVTNFIYKYPDQDRFELRTFEINTDDLQKLFLQPEVDFASSNTSIKSGGVLNFINWIKNKNVTIVFPDSNYMFIPFSKFLKKDVPRDYTIQSSLLFSKNTAVTSTRFIQNGNLKANVNNPLNSPRFISVEKPENINLSENWFNSVNLEISAKEFNGSSSVLTAVIEKRSPASLAILSYNVEDKKQLVLYVNSINLLFAASNMTAVTHLMGSRNSMEKTVAQILDGSITDKDDIIFSGNPDISGVLINNQSIEAKKYFVQYQKQELEKCDQTTKKFDQNLQFQNALNNLEQCDGIYNDMQSRMTNLYKDGKDSKEILPDFGRFHTKIKILLESGTDTDLSKVPKEFDLFIKHSVQKNGEVPDIFPTQIVKYMNLLLGAGYEKMALDVLKLIPEKSAFSNDVSFSILESYFLGKLYSGDISGFLKDVPEMLKTLIDNSQVKTSDLPENLKERINFFLKNTSYRENWLNAMVQSGEYNYLLPYMDYDLKLTQWQKVNLLVSAKTGKENFKFKDFLLSNLGKLLNSDYDFSEFNRIVNVSITDPSMKDFSMVIQSAKIANADQVKNSSQTFLKQIDEQDPDGFYKKQALINFLLNYIDYEKFPENFNTGLLGIISNITFGKNIKNLQQGYFSELAGSTNTFATSSEKLNDFLKKYNGMLSNVNLDFIKHLLTVCLSINPYEGLKIMERNHELLKMDEKGKILKLKNLVNGVISYSELPYSEFSLVEKYFIMANDYDKALNAYFSYDRNQSPGKFEFEKNLSGVFQIYADQYFSWIWNQKKITIMKINPSDIKISLLSNADDIIYIPAKDTNIKKTILSNDLGLRYFSKTAISSHPVESTKAGDYSWSYGQEMMQSPGYSIMKMFLPPQNNDKPSRIGYYDKPAGKSVVNFYDQALDAGQINPSGANQNPKYHILYTDPALFNIYLTFMKEFVKESIEEIDLPLTLFGKVIKKMEKIYGNTEDLKYLIILQQ